MIAAGTGRSVPVIVTTTPEKSVPTSNPGTAPALLKRLTPRPDAEPLDSVSEKIADEEFLSLMVFGPADNTRRT